MLPLQLLLRLAHMTPRPPFLLLLLLLRVLTVLAWVLWCLA